MLSVVLPVYNAEKTLPACLASLESDLSGGRVELIAVDDGSTDGSRALLDAFAKRFAGRVRVLHRPNGGQGAARNLAMRHAGGSHLGFVDADDTVEAGMFTRMLDAALRHDADMTVCDFVKCTGDGHETVVRMTELPSVPTDPAGAPHLLFACGNSAWNKVVRRDTARREGFVFEEGMAYEDLASVPLWITHCRRIVRVAEPLYRHHLRPESTTHRTGQSMEDHLQALRRLSERVRDPFREAAAFLVLGEIVFQALPRFAVLADGETFRRFCRASVAFFVRTWPRWYRNRYWRSLPVAKRFYAAVVLSGVCAVVKPARRWRRI